MLIRTTHHRKMVHRWTSTFVWICCWWWLSTTTGVESSRSLMSLSRSYSSYASSYSSSRSSQGIAGTIMNETVCANIDIRNSVLQFRKLTNCTVVEGFVQILLIDNASTKDFENLTFPKLREITDYLLLYRVQGLTSLSRLFPNLSVIKGQNVFHNYALVIFEMRSMHDVGLVSLTAIARGSVRIEKNPHLCYVDTIDWDHIAQSGRGGHFTKENVPYEQCPNACPAENCAVGSLAGGKQLKLCWNSNVCQKICSPDCQHRNLTCSTESHCCHPECIGGCFGNHSTDCVACRHVSFQGKCMRTCPPGTYEYLERRCVQENECRMMKNQLSILPSSHKVVWKPFRDKCLSKCPPGYMENKKDRHRCDICKDRCPKVCDPAVVDSVASAQKLRDCTFIDGSLEIQIQGGENVIKELETSLSSIQEIRGYLKIARSFSLISLNFLKDLTYIRGEFIDKKEYAFIVLDNQNLQELWDWKNRKKRLRIGGGKIFFHFNSKLCPNKIEELKYYADVMDWDDRDVSPSSNGDRVACDVTNINISVWDIQCGVAGLKWKNFRKQNDNIDFRSLLGYVVYYREAPDRNVTKFDGRDACGSDVWKVDDVDAMNDEADYVMTIIPQLKPYTTYAAYMRTYTIASARFGAESDIIYFTTKPYTPSPPVNIRAHSTGHGDIVVTWKGPKKPNGNVTHYIVDGIREKDLTEFVSQRNYCIEPLVLPRFNIPHFGEQPEKDIHWLPDGSTPQDVISSEKCCSCSTKSSLEDDENDAEFRIDFEDFLHNNVYIKNPDPERNKKIFDGKKNSKPLPTVFKALKPTMSSFTRAYFELTSATFTTTSTTTEISYENTTDDKPLENSKNRFHHVIYDDMFLVINNLHHFTEYTIEVRACQDALNATCSNAPECSTQAITTVRTLPLGGADDIDSGSIILNTDNVTYGSIFIKWAEPKDPNGLIVSYNVEIKQAESNEHKSIPYCITQIDFMQKMGHIFTDLMPGNYSLKLRATSLAGNGNWTKPMYFLIPDVKDGLKPEVLAVLSVLAVVFGVLIITGIFCFKKKYGPHIPDGILYASVNPEYVSAGLVYEPDSWEVPREKMTIMEELGQGSFGMVYKGVLKGWKDVNDNIPCAIKTVNESASMRERIEFLQEASVMKAFSCHHIVKLLGVVSKGHPTLVIMELMSKGDLKAFLRSHRPDNEDPDVHPPTYKEILQMAIEIADGMAYLSAKKYVHRDLAARNCMVSENNTVKIGDFGMTRDIYETDYYRKGGKGLLPVRWMAPECLKDGVFSCQSDIWSYGVVLWEMATFASQPYQGLANEQVLSYVIAGRIIDEPENCPEKLYALMKLCWEYNPKARPTFTEIIEMLLPDTNEERFREKSFYFTQRTETLTKESEPADAATTSTPLRIRWMEPSNSREESDEENDVQYFPATRNVSEDNYICTNVQGDCTRDNCDLAAAAGNDGSKGYSIHSNEGSKGMSVTSSDGSKGSKVSNISNGSIANGRASFAMGRTTMC